MKYFAYGTNMDRKRLQERCPNARFISKAILEDFRLIFNKLGVATIVEDDDFSTPGLLYELSNDDIKNLDRFEGFPNNAQHWLQSGFRMSTP